MGDLRITPVGATSAERLELPQLHPPSASFGEALGQVMAEVNDLQLKGGEAARDVAAVQSADMTRTMMAIAKADVSLQFVIQIRNKLLEAYQEMMRMPV